MGWFVLTCLGYISITLLSLIRGGGGVGFDGSTALRNGPVGSPALRGVAPQLPRAMRGRRACAAGGPDGSHCQSSREALSPGPYGGIQATTAMHNDTATAACN